MRGISVISLIAFCVLAVFVNNNGLTEGHSLKDYLRGLSTLKELPNLRHGILPGTRWCGVGDIARKDSELGTYAEMDACCRDHDRCEDYITSKSTRYGLYNQYVCRSSLCECELQFRNCLKQLRGIYAYAVKRIYFRHCRQCFRIFYDPQECTNEGLDIIEEMDRKGRRVFCAKFDRIPKWGHRHNTTMPQSTSATEFPIKADDETVQLISRFYSGEDEEDLNDDYDGEDLNYEDNAIYEREKKDSNDKDNAIYERDTSIPGYKSDTDYINII